MGYRKYKSTTSRNSEENLRVKKEWLKGCKSLCSNVGIDIAKVKQFFSHEYGISLTNKPVGEILWENVGFQILTWTHYLI